MNGRERYVLWTLLVVWMLSFPVGELWARPEREVPPITLRVKGMPLAEVLSEIERQAGVTFSYESSLLDGLPEVSLDLSEVSLEDCLDRLFKPSGVAYETRGSIVILRREPRRVTVSGFVRDAGSSAPLDGASVYEVGGRTGGAANSDGFFSLTLPAGDVGLRVSYIGYGSVVLRLPALARDTLLNVELRSNARVAEVVVTASGQEPRPAASPLMGTLGFSQRTIRKIPVVFGEADIVKTLQLTPGVSSGTEGLAGMYVRGGDSDGNLFLVDNSPVYQVNHLGGLFSAFNPEVVRGMDFFKGGFPARYGGRLSSVVDVRTKEGNMREFHGSATLGLISGGLSLEGPIVKDRTAFQVALRRSWLDVLSAPTLAIINKVQKKKGNRLDMRYAFHDVNVKLNHRFSERSRLAFTLYNGSDLLKGGRENFPREGEQAVYSDATDASLRWGNLMGTLGWTYVFTNRLFGRISGVFNRYRAHITSTRSYSFGDEGEANRLVSSSEASSSSSIWDMGVRSAFDYTLSASHRLRFGGDFLLHRFRPEHEEKRISGSDLSGSYTEGKRATDDLLWGREAALFAEDDWTLSPAVRLNGGLRLSLFNIQRRTYTLLEPRLSARWLLREDLSLKASYARMGQYVHLLSDTYINLPTDSWMPVTRRLKPLVSDQVSAGVYYDLWRSYNFSIEGYYKRMKNLLDYKDGYSYLPASASWEDKLTAGDGRSYGVEFLMRKASGKTTGWIGYTLSWADRRFDEIDNGRRFPARYDNRHKLNIVVSRKLSEKVELTAAWTYASGNRMTLSLENYEPANPVWHPSGEFPGYYGYVTDNWETWNDGYALDYYSGRNNYRLPAYHRLDLGINIYRPKKKGRMGIWTISVYNAYCRMNTFVVRKGWKGVPSYDMAPGGYGSSYNGGTDNRFEKIGLIPIVPSVSYTYKF